MDGLRPSEKTIKNDFHSAAFGHWPKVFGQGKGWKPTLWWPLNWQHTLSQTSIMQLHIISGVPDNLCTHILGSVVYTEDVTLVCVIGLPWKKAGALTLKIWHTPVQGLLHSKKCTRPRQWMRHRHYPFLCTIQTEQEARECVGDLQKTMLLALILNQCNRNPFGFDCFINQACLVWWDHLHVPYFPSTLLNICPVSMAQVAR